MPSGTFAAVFADEPAHVKPVVAKSTKILKLTARKKAFIVKWKKVSASGYQIQYSTKKSFSKKYRRTITVKSSKKVSYTVKKLKSKKKYYVRVRTYKLSGKKHVYSKWSSVRSVRVK